MFVYETQNKTLLKFLVLNRLFKSRETLEPFVY